MGTHYVHNVPGLSLLTSYASQLTPLPALTCDWVPPLLVMPDTSEFIERRRGAALLVTFVCPQRVWFEKNVVVVICTFIRSPEGVILKQYCGCDLYFHMILRRCDLKKKLWVWFVLSYNPQKVWFEKNICGCDMYVHMILRRCDLKKYYGCDLYFHTILRRCNLEKNVVGVICTYSLITV